MTRRRGERGGGLRERVAARTQPDQRSKVVDTFAHSDGMDLCVPSWVQEDRLRSWLCTEPRQRVPVGLPELVGRVEAHPSTSGLRRAAMAARACLRSIWGSVWWPH